MTHASITSENHLIQDMKTRTKLFSIFACKQRYLSDILDIDFTEPILAHGGSDRLGPVVIEEDSTINDDIAGAFTSLLAPHMRRTSVSRSMMLESHATVKLFKLHFFISLSTSPVKLLFIYLISER